MARAAAYDRDAAIDAALTLFWSKGFHATSLKDLEGVLNMKPGSIYAAFTSKEALYLVALERYFERSRAHFWAQTQGHAPLAALAAHLRAFARLSGEDAGRQACMLTKTFVDTRTTDPQIATRTRAYLDDMHAEFAAVFERAIASGEIAATADPQRLARRYQANITALRLAAHQGMAGDAFAQLADDMAGEIESLRKSAGDAQSRAPRAADDRQFDLPL